MTWDFKTRPELPNSQMDFYYWESPHKQIFESFRANVVKVHDGDTIRVRTDFRDFAFPIRFLGTNSPELNEEGGHEVKYWLENQILGREIYIEVDPKQRVGKWGRLLGKIFHEGIDMGEDMIRQGFAATFEARNEGKFPDLNKEFNIEKWA